MSNTTYYILVNTDLAYDHQYTIRGEQRRAHKLGAVISRHYTLEAALKAQARLGRYTAMPQTDVFKLHFFIGADDYLAEQYGGANDFTYRPVSALKEGK